MMIDEFDVQVQPSQNMVSNSVQIHPAPTSFFAVPGVAPPLNECARKPTKPIQIQTWWAPPGSQPASQIKWREPPACLAFRQPTVTRPLFNIQIRRAPHPRGRRHPSSPAVLDLLRPPIPDHPDHHSPLNRERDQERAAASYPTPFPFLD